MLKMQWQTQQLTGQWSLDTVILTPNLAPLVFQDVFLWIRATMLPVRSLSWALSPRVIGTALYPPPKLTWTVSINMHLFALLHWHNISEIGHAMLQLFLTSAAVSVRNMAQARAHAINYNAWSITDRMLGIGYANWGTLTYVIPTL